jgi:protein-L-isoaspartate(D-aspartate) O-methyltransferase
MALPGRPRYRENDGAMTPGASERATGWAGALGAVLLAARVATGAAGTDATMHARARMVDEQIAARGVHDPRVLAALRRIPRHEFVPEAVRDEAYEDRPLAIGDGQTISQPYIVAVMTELARVGPKSRVLEVGTGSGYQAAVLAEVAAEVWSVEIVPALAARAAATLARLGYDRVHLRQGDGWRGWPEAAPFDAILVTAAAPHVPPALRAQLAPAGRLVIPVGDADDQALEVHTRGANGFTVERVFPVRFVPLTGGVR